MNDKRFIIGQVVTVIIAIVGQVITIAIAIVGWHITTNNTKSQIENSVDIEVAQQIINARPYMLTGKGKYKNGSIIASASKHIDFNKISNEDLTYIENNGSNPLNNLTISSLGNFIVSNNSTVSHSSYGVIVSFKRL